jgi:hypothetical protein
MPDVVPEPEEPEVIVVEDVTFPATEHCLPIDRLTQKSPVYDLGELAEKEMRVYKMAMHKGQTVRITTTSDIDYDMLARWNDCPWISEDQEWAEYDEMVMTDVDESKQEVLTMTAEENADLYIGVYHFDWDDTEAVDGNP